MSKDKPHESKGVLTSIELTGQETDAECKEIAWRMFCAAHPVEAYHQDPEAFWKYFHEIAPGVSRERMEQTVKECEESENKQ